MIAGIENKGLFGRIKRMPHIWRMWRMVHKLYRIQTDYFELDERDQKNLDILNGTLYRRTECYVQRHILSLKNYDKSMILGSTDAFRNLPRERFTSQDVIDNCIKAGFMGKQNPQRDISKSVALTEKGLEFKDPFYLLKYLITELGVVWTFLGAIVGTVLLKDSIFFLGSVLWEAAKIAISSL